MNLIKVAILVSVVTGLSACIKKIEYTPPDLRNPKLDNTLNSLKEGGQPGAITLSGAVVKSDGTVDDRLTIEQAVGKSDQKTVILPANLPKLNAELKRKVDYQPTKFGTYLNVGCDLTNDSRIEGMTESKNTPNKYGITYTFGTASAVVDKIFICGQVSIDESVVLLNANEIYMDNAELSMAMPLGSISINSDMLSIEGKNLISTVGDASSIAYVLSASSIKLNIFEKLSGAGTLKLKSIGGDYLANDAK